MASNLVNRLRKEARFMDRHSAPTAALLREAAREIALQRLLISAGNAGAVKGRLDTRPKETAAG